MPILGSWDYSCDHQGAYVLEGDSEKIINSLSDISASEKNKQWSGIVSAMVGLRLQFQNIVKEDLTEKVKFEQKPEGEGWAMQM